jgi:hypothetical protein
VLVTVQQAGDAPGSGVVDGPLKLLGVPDTALGRGHITKPAFGGELKMVVCSRFLAAELKQYEELGKRR